MGIRSGKYLHQYVAAAHAITRARERYDLDLHSTDLVRIARRIQSGDRAQARMVARHPTGGREAWLVSWQEQWILVAYETRGRAVATFLPLGQEFTDDGRAVMEDSTLEDAEEHARRRHG